MKKTISKHGITITCELNADESVNTSQKMQVSYLDSNKNIVEFEAYPDKNSNKATVKGQFEYIKSSIDFDQVYIEKSNRGGKTPISKEQQVRQAVKDLLKQWKNN